MCPKMLCHILTGMLNTSIDYFQRKLLLQIESCTVQSVKVYSQSCLIAMLGKSTKCSEWHFLSNGMVLTTLGGNQGIKNTCLQLDLWKSRRQEPQKGLTIKQLSTLLRIKNLDWASHKCLNRRHVRDHLLVLTVQEFINCNKLLVLVGNRLVHKQGTSLSTVFNVKVARSPVFSRSTNLESKLMEFFVFVKF